MRVRMRKESDPLSTCHSSGSASARFHVERVTAAITKAGMSHLLQCYNVRWRRDVVVSGVRRMNEVNPRRARLVLEWVTDFGRVYHLGM